jgi:hypothetical protein
MKCFDIEIKRGKMRERTMVSAKTRGKVIGLKLVFAMNLSSFVDVVSVAGELFWFFSKGILVVVPIVFCSFSRNV